ncbi:retrovirus-related pol polyprotein from transposon TNT 1-94 [Tanacetum coccineum]
MRSKDETPEFVINFLKQIQVGLNETVRYIRTDNGTEFVNQVMPKYYEVFGALCYPTNDSEDLGKLQAKADIGIFVGYAPSRKGFRIYNKRTRRIMETIHVTFDELHQTMAPVRISSGPEPFMMTPGQLNSGLAPSPIVSTNTSVSTTFAQDAPSTSHPLSSSHVHPSVFPQSVAAGPTIEDTSLTQAGLHPSINPVAGEPSST